MLILCVTIFLPTTVSTGLQGMPCQLESQVHSTNTLIDEVGLVEMEVGLDQLTWGDADLQRELRRLKDNSLKIPNLKYIFKIALLRVIPTLTHYSDIVSDIIWTICGIYVLTYYLTFFSEIRFDILSGILSGIYSDILSGIYYILILPCHEFGLGVLLFAWINANGLNIHQMLVSHVCTQWLPLPLIPQNGQVLNLRVGPEKFSGYWKNRTLAQGLKKDVGGRFRYAVGLQSWANFVKFRLWTHVVPYVDSCWLAWALIALSTEESHSFVIRTVKRPAKVCRPSRSAESPVSVQLGRNNEHQRTKCWRVTKNLVDYVDLAMKTYDIVWRKMVEGKLEFVFASRIKTVQVTKSYQASMDGFQRCPRLWWSLETTRSLQSLS